MEDRIDIDEEIYISAITPGDKHFYVQLLNDPGIHETTLRIPYPYTESDAQYFVEAVQMQKMLNKRQMNWAIRNSNGDVIGGIGLHGKYSESPHRDELGYWVARSYWGRGIMTRVLKTLCRFLQDEYGLTRIEAPVFESNIGSCRVVEKCGFAMEGIMRKAYFKNGKYIDGKLYALVK